MGEGRVRVERDGAVLVVTLDRPEKLNAYDGPMLKAVGAAWEELDADAGLRAGVLTGAGDRAFCAGADISALGGGSFGEGPFPEVAENLSAKPVIAAINGICLAGGMMYATGCDVRIAEEHAEFGVSEARWNLPAHWLGALARQMLPAHVLELSLWAADRVGAQRMYEMGWVNRVVPRGASLDEALRWGHRVAEMAPAAVRAFKRLTMDSWYLPPAQSLELGMAQTRALADMEDSREGPRAFAERRKPVFRDR